MNSAEKNSNQKTDVSASLAGLSSTLSKLDLETRLEFLKNEVSRHPWVAVSTIITDQELSDYYVKGIR